LKAFILANGPVRDYAFLKREIARAQIIVACDGGLRHAEAIGVAPDSVVGDMDSADPGPLANYESGGAKIIRYPADKDDSDFALALDHAITLGASEIVAFGALGGRFDHAAANVCAMYGAMQKNVRARLQDERTCVFFITGSETVNREGYDYISLFPFDGEARGVSTRGLKYPIKSETLRAGETRGLSNRFVGEHAEISVGEGVLLAVKARE